MNDRVKVLGLGALVTWGVSEGELYWSLPLRTEKDGIIWLSLSKEVREEILKGLGGF